MNKPFANDSFGNKDGMSQGRGRYSHNMSRGSGSKQFNGKPSSKYVYRQKSPATDVIPNSPEAGGSQLRQPECFVACGDGLHSFAAQSDSKTPTPDLIQNSPEAEGSHMKQPESFSSPELVSGADLPILPVHSDSRNILLDMTRMQIKETPEEETEETTTVNNDFSFSVEVKDEWMGKEPFLPAKADIQDQAFQEKDVKNLAGIGGSGHSVQQPVVYLFDICPPKTGIISLKPSLLVTNRNKRNQVKLAMEGQNGEELRSGMVLLKNYLSISDQVLLYSLFFFSLSSDMVPLSHLF